MKKFLNTALNFVIILSVLFTITSCSKEPDINVSNVKDEIVSETKEDIALNYLKEKYSGTEFEILSCGSGFGDPYISVLFKDDVSDEIYDLMIYENNSCKDNYYGQFIRKSYDKYIEELLASNGFPGCIVYTDFNHVHGKEIGINLTAQEIINLDNKLGKNTNIFIEQGSLNPEELKSFILETDIYGSYNIYEIIDMESIGTAETLREYVKDINNEKLDYSFNTF